MIYLATPNTQGVKDAIAAGRLGALLTPDSWSSLNEPQSSRFPWVGLDNGCFSTKRKWSESRWVDWLQVMVPRQPECLFAVVPDVVGDHERTMERWLQFSPTVKKMGYPAAFVVQDGATIDALPFDQMDALFMGGSTEFKLSQAAWEMADHARSLGVWTHLGRCNSFTRLRAAAHTYRSADGTYLAFGPDTNLPKLLSWLDWLDHNQPMHKDYA